MNPRPTGTGPFDNTNAPSEHSYFAAEELSSDHKLPLNSGSDGSDHFNQGPSATRAKPMRRLWTWSTASRFLQNVAFTATSLYFVVFAALVYQQDGIPAEASRSKALLDAAQYGPTIFAIVFAAITGRFLKSAATILLERGSRISTIEVLLGGRTVSAAGLLPVTLKFMHPLMPFLMLLWAFSPIGGQAALRVVSRAPDTVYTDTSIVYLDVEHSPALVADVGTGRNPFGNAILSAFNAALGSSALAKSVSPDPYGNLRVPMIESKAADAVLGLDGWYTLGYGSDIQYNSLAGLPILGLASTDGATFMVETSYMYPDCSLSGKEIETPFYKSGQDFYPLNASSPILNNGRYLTFIMDLGHNMASSLPPVITMWSDALINDAWYRTEATCNLLTTYLELQTVCAGTACSTLSMRRSKLPHLPATASSLDGIFTPNPTLSTLEPTTQRTFFSLLINATTQNLANVPDNQPSPFEYYLANPASPFSAPANAFPNLTALGDETFSQRLGQLMNTMWLDSVAPYALMGNFTAAAPTVESYQVSHITGQTVVTTVVLHCHRPWLVVLLFASIVAFFAGVGTVALDGLRRGPNVLDSFAAGLRESRFVSLEGKSSMEDGACSAKRLRDVRVRLGDVEPDGFVGHVAVGTVGEGRGVEGLRKGRLYA